ncbi:MAG: DUF3791 domain-containing protein [Chitinivibrionia bacterium]|nr:DUF3791 domain-containing protein [Chitinivibrionia bacterium]
MGDVFEQAEKVLGREKRIRMSYTNYMIHKFAETYKIGKPEGYIYLKQYGGLDFIREHWWALHVDNQLHSVRSVFKICQKNGGYLV